MNISIKSMKYWKTGAIDLFDYRTTCGLLGDSSMEWRYNTDRKGSGSVYVISQEQVSDTGGKLEVGEGVEPEPEADINFNQNQSRNGVDRDSIVGSVRTSTRIKKIKKHGPSARPPSTILQNYLKSIRDKSKSISKNISLIPENHLKDLYLMREFLLFSMSSANARFVVAKYMWMEGPIDVCASIGVKYAQYAQADQAGVKRRQSVMVQLRDKWSSTRFEKPFMVPLLCLVGLIAYVFFAGVFLFGISLAGISSNLTALWTFVVACSIIQDSVVVLPVYIYTLWIAIPALVSGEVDALNVTLSKRFQVILKRTCGVISLNSINSMVQYFHPVCVAARDHPHLPVAHSYSPP